MVWVNQEAVLRMLGRWLPRWD